MEKRKLILRNFLSPGDLVMLTAAVRDLHRCHPDRFLTDVRTSCPELWQGNPHLTPLSETDPGVEQIDCHYPLIDRSNEAPFHCIHGFTDFLSTRLRLPIRPTVFRGDIHLAAEERHWKSVVHELAGMDLPFWIVNAGGKFDYTIKWWDWKRYQRVIDYFRGQILFVQVGELGHYHPPLKHVIDLRGKTELRQFVRLIYHSQGVLCGVTALMHLAAAVPTRPDRPADRAAVIIAGGREPTHWEAYPHHQFLHTVGALRCCATGGCWRSRTRAIGDGEVADRPENLCLDVVGDLPRCMSMITADQVIRRIKIYFDGGSMRYLTERENRAAQRAVVRSIKGPRFDTTIHLGSVTVALERAAREARQSRPPVMSGRGILLLVRTPNELVPALACARTLRSLGSKVDIECWSTFGISRRAVLAWSEVGVTTQNVLPDSPGWKEPWLPLGELRLLALARTRSRAVLALAPGHIPLMAPDQWFGNPRFQNAGVLLADAGASQARPGVWKLCGLTLPGRTAGAEIVLIDRRRCWSALCLWRWVIERLYFYRGYVTGDGGAAQFAFAKLNRPAPVSAHLPRNFWSRESGTPAPARIERELRAAQKDLGD